MMTGLERIVEVLAVHVEVGGTFTPDGDWIKYVCKCGEVGADHTWHRTHLADILAEIVAGVWYEAYRAGLDDAHDHALGLAAGRLNPYRTEDAATTDDDHRPETPGGHR